MCVCVCAKAVREYSSDQNLMFYGYQIDNIIN